MFAALFELLLLFVATKFCIGSLVSLFSPDDLRYTFGVNSIREVPKHRFTHPQLLIRQNSTFYELLIELDEGNIQRIPLQPITSQLLADRLTIVRRTAADGGGHLETAINPLKHFDDCHFHYNSTDMFLAISNCEEGELKGSILLNGSLWVLHPIPQRHKARMRRSTNNENNLLTHVIYKRDTVEGKKDEEFCGIENTISSDELLDNEAGIHEDVFVVGQRMSQESDLIVELAIFVDEELWRHFSSRHGSLAWQKLQQYALTMLSNIQIMYKQPTALPTITFKVVRYEVFQSQPSALAAHLHENGNAQRYLDRFCRYQRSLGVQDWDHALLLTGYDIHRGYGANSISGIARLDGMCDPWNTCTLAEGLDFTSAFIGTHELGHSVGMRHDEPYCSDNYIMSSSLGPGKVTWSTCSLRDYQNFIQRLDSKNKNCLRVSLLREKMPMRDTLKPGQIYDAHEQCRLMHGSSYVQVSPRTDHYDGICNMMWCGQGSYGRIVTSHPALEGTFCGDRKWCSLGRCVPWTGFGAPLSPRPSISQYPPSYVTSTVATTTNVYPTSQQIINGQWSGWSPFDCKQCSCPSISGSIGVTLSRRSCSNPEPLNGGAECQGPSQRAAVCARKCAEERNSVNQYISSKCAEHKYQRNDPELTGSGSQLTRFPQRACKIFCDVQNAFGSQRNYRFYGDNLPDGAPCGWDRYCLNGECTELSCEDTILAPDDQRSSRNSCPSSHERCPVENVDAKSMSNGQWGQWSIWSSCTASCGDLGVQIRSRTCNINNRCEGEPTQNQPCNRHVCPTTPAGEPQWTDWTPWTQCSVSCGHGSQARYRRCQNSQGSVAFSCQGQTMELRNCDEIPCNSGNRLDRSDAQWTGWSVWSVCSVTCGPGFQSRTRSCFPQSGACDGSWQQRMACNLRECSGGWNTWGVWSECSRLCGKGVRSRSRTCPTDASCPGSSTEQSFCNEQPCAEQETLNAQWSGWSVWGPCSATCGNGVRRRTRHCQWGNCPGHHFDSSICNNGQCSVEDASWGGWGYWSVCSESCGQGFRRRVRKCYGSGQCPGSEYEREQCQVRSTC